MKKFASLLSEFDAVVFDQAHNTRSRELIEIWGKAGAERAAGVPVAPLPGCVRVGQVDRRHDSRAEAGVGGSFHALAPVERAVQATAAVMRSPGRAMNMQMRHVPHGRRGLSDGWAGAR